MDTAEWPQEVMVKAMEDKISKTCSSSLTAAATNNSSSNTTNHHKAPLTSVERKIRPQKDDAVNCPRCNSGNTKFCYYNNYSLTQPRYLCKTCKRYWTEGGSLRNIPVGGGSRLNKRSSSKSSSTCTSPASKRLSSHDLVAATQSHHLMSNPNNNHYNSKMMMMMISQSQSQQAQDLNLGFPPTQLHQDYTSLCQLIQLPSMDTTPYNPNDNGGYSSGYPSLQDLKPSLNFSLDGIGQDHGYGGDMQVHQGEAQNGGGRLLFPFEDLKQTSNDNDNDDDDDNKNEKEERSGRDENGDSSSSNGFWNGMLGAGESPTCTSLLSSDMHKFH